jgi:MoxR-like ATPase
MGNLKKGFLRQLGVYGYNETEVAILASLVSEDPLLLIGKAGTGKTFLLNSLSEALDLSHRHYNASLIAFDDLVGFPWPDNATGGIRYLETPATIWGAESVLVDEINRCKPEHQNRLFSLVQEKRIQGLKLDKLQYRWAAMNPPGIDQDGEGYLGCEPLDAALADRFAFIIEVADWSELSQDDQKLIADPRGEGVIARDELGVAGFVKEAKVRLKKLNQQPPEILLEYARRAASAMGEAGVRFSPRRVRQLAKNLLALTVVCDMPRESLFLKGLEWSIPQRATGVKVEKAVVLAAHRVAWESSCTDKEDQWLHEFHWKKNIDEKVSFLLGTSQCPDTGTVAVAQFLATASKAEAAAFSASLYPAMCHDPSHILGEEGVQDLGKIAQKVFSVDKVLTWRDGKKIPYLPPGGGRYEENHKDFSPLHRFLGGLRGQRKKRAKQLFYYLLTEGMLPDDLEAFEERFHQCVLLAKKYHATKLS